jgi:hypothetical protein
MQLLKVSGIVFLIGVILTIALFFNSILPFAPVLYIIALFLLIVVPITLITRMEGSVAVAILLNPVLLLSFDTFFLRLGIYNYFIYIDNGWHPLLTKDFLIKASILAIIGNLFLWLGFIVLKKPDKIIKNIIRKIEIWSKVDINIIERKLWILFVLGVITRMYLLSNGLFGYFGNAEAKNNAASFITYLSFIEQLAPLSMVAFFATQMNKNKNRNWVAFGCMFAIEITTVFLSGFKGMVIFRFIYIAITYAYFTRKFPIYLLGIGLLFLLIIFPINMLLRDQFQNDEFSSKEIGLLVGKTVENSKTVFSGEEKTNKTKQNTMEQIVRASAQLDKFAMAIRYIDKTGNTLHGEDLRDFFYAFIPRIIWPQKPLLGNRGGWFYREVLGYGGKSADSMTVPGNFYLNYGIIGVPIGFLILGFLLKIITMLSISGTKSLRMGTLLPFILFAYGLPTSALGVHYAGATRQIVVILFIITVLIFPKKKKDLSVNAKMIYDKNQIELVHAK